MLQAALLSVTEASRVSKQNEMVKTKALSKRIDRSFKNLAAFSDEILVRCPHCHQQAAILSDVPSNSVPYPCPAPKARFACSSCYKSIKEDAWYGPVAIAPVNAQCGHCGSALESAWRIVKEYKSKMEVTCTACGQARLYDTAYKRTYANSQQASDPYFGLPLWLQAPFGSHTVWAYNRKHLAYLKEYVQAKLRESASGGRHALTWKLPNFIKLAKNRDGILKIIARLEKNG